MSEEAVPRRRLTCLSTFTGLGGMDLGLEEAGFEHLACVEWDAAARLSIEANAPKWNLLREGDIEEVARRLEPGALGLEVGELDLLVGAPPCQPYSKAAQWTSSGRLGLDDRRGQYLGDFLSLLATFRPKVVLIENVRGFIQGKTSALPYINECLAALPSLGHLPYEVHAKVLDAVDYGVPQRRSRAIVVISRVGGAFAWPDTLEGTVAWDAIGGLEEGDVPKASGRWADLLPSIPEGENYLFHTDRGEGQQIFGYRTRYWSFLLKLAKNQASWTLPAHPGPATGPFHWDNRPLSVAEMLRLQSFPAEWVVEGSSRYDRVRQIGNATPPLLAEVLGRAVASHIDPSATFESPPSLSIPARRPVPAPRRPLAVTDERYLEMVQDHEDHPGHGKGPGAVKAKREAQRLAMSDVSADPM